MKRAFFGTSNLTFWTLTIVGLWAVLLFGRDIRRLYDEHILARPWIVAEIEIVDAGTVPLVKYKAHARLEVSGRWAAWVQTFHNGGPVRGCGGSGEGNYRPNGKVARFWGWADFLGENCPVPKEPYQICARYAVKTESGAFGIFGPDCSDVHRP